MARYNGIKKRLCILISGKGSNLLSIIKNTYKKNYPAKVVLIVTNNSSAKGILYGKKYKIPLKIIKKKNILLFENILFKEIQKKNIDLICLAGFMRILSKKFIKKFRNKILNIHPSLLPKYKGLNTHKRVLINKESESGCTVHFVSEKLDSGKIIMQNKVKISKNETEKSLNFKVLKKEHILYPRAIKKIILSYS
tara:strand:+ start:84 stop:668 length:585 start_codon:yes stop_codon:yes gene_type:complete